MLIAFFVILFNISINAGHVIEYSIKIKAFLILPEKLTIFFASYDFIFGVDMLIRILKQKWSMLKTEAVVWRCSGEKVFLDISQNSQENACTRVSFLIKYRLWCRFFPVNFAKFLRTPFLIKHLR